MAKYLSTFNNPQVNQKIRLYSEWDDLEWCDSMAADYFNYLGWKIPIREAKNHLYMKQFRKLCVFLQREFDEVLYLDVDTIVLRNLESLFGFLQMCDIGFGMETGREYVYNETIKLAEFGETVPTYNTGMFLVRNQLFNKSEIKETMAVGTRDRLLSKSGSDQALMNLMVLRKGVKHLNLNCAIWGFADFVVEGGRVAGRPELYMMHWAGPKVMEGLPHIELIRQFFPNFTSEKPKMSFVRWLSESLHFS